MWGMQQRNSLGALPFSRNPVGAPQQTRGRCMTCHPTVRVCAHVSTLGKGWNQNPESLFPTGVVLKLGHESESPGKLVKTQTVGPHAQRFEFS